jgi:hypothetical protein
MNEIHLYLLERLAHADGCKSQRCLPSCDVLAFNRSLDEPLLLVDQRRAEQIHERLEELARGDIPA